MANGSGGLRSLSAEGEETPFGDNVLAKVSGFDAARGLLALGSQKWIRALSTDLLTGASSPTFLHTSLAANPFSSSIGLFFVPARKLLAWRTDNALPGLAVMDVSGIDVPATPPAAVRGLPSGFRAPLSDLRASGDSAVGIETGGVVRLTETATGVSSFELHLPGASTAIVGSATELVVGRNAAAASGSLLKVNMRTGETVSIRDRNGFTYGLLLDSTASGGPLLYSVGIDHAGATNLLLHDGPGFERETVLDSIPEEDLDASLALDPDTHLLYATLGRDRIVCWDGKQLKRIEAENCAPRRLAARDGLLYSLNKDSTVSVLQSDTGARLAEISLFADGEWCALLRDGRYAASPGGDIHVKVFEEDAPVEATEDLPGADRRIAQGPYAGPRSDASVVRGVFPDLLDRLGDGALDLLGVFVLVLRARIDASHQGNPIGGLHVVQGVRGHVENAVLAGADVLCPCHLDLQLTEHHALRLVDEAVEIVAVPQSHRASLP